MGFAVEGVAACCENKLIAFEPFPTLWAKCWRGAEVKEKLHYTIRGRDKTANYDV